MKTRILPLPLIALLLASFFVQQCTAPAEPEPLLIGISKGAPASSYGNYAKWLVTVDTTVVCVDL